MNDALISVLYHYTTKQALDAILRTEELKPSLLTLTPGDVRYGEGQYLTDVEPGKMSGSRLSRLLLGHPFEGRRFTHFLEVDVTGLKVNQGRMHVFVIPSTVGLPLERNS